MRATCVMGRETEIPKEEIAHPTAAHPSRYKGSRGQALGRTCAAPEKPAWTVRRYACMTE